jgi:hypothetical protein
MLGAMALTILVLIGMVATRRAPLGLRIGGLLAASLLGVTMSGSGLMRWRGMLRANLSEVADTPPLPVPLSFVLETLAVLLVTSGPVAGGALLMLACREANRGSSKRALRYVFGLWYVVHWAPWVVTAAP